MNYCDIDGVGGSTQSEKTSAAPLNKLSYLIKLFGYAIASNILMLSMPIYLAQIYDRVLPSSSVETLIYLTMLILFCLALFGLVESKRGTIAKAFGWHYEASQALNIIQQNLERHHVSSQRYAGLLQDLSFLRQTISSRAFISLFDLPFTPLFMILLFLIHPWIGAVAVIGASILLLVAMVVHVGSRSHREVAADLEHGYKAQKSILIARSDLIVSLGMGRWILERWQKSAIGAVSGSLDIGRWQNGISGFSKFFRQSIQVCVLGTGAYLVLQGSLSAGVIFAASIITGRALMPIDALVGGLLPLLAASSAHERMIAHQKVLQTNHSTLIKLPLLQGQIRCTNLGVVDMQSEDQRMLLRNISLEMKSGEMIAVIGRSGSSKSIFVATLAGWMTPTDGMLEFDGHSIDQWPSDQLGSQIGYVDDGSCFFEGSIASNISRFDPDATDEQVISAAKAVGLHKQIGSLKDGYNTMLASDGSPLSKGQKQWVKLARAFYNDPQILLLDEPENNLDQMAENDVFEAIQRAKASGKTIVIATRGNRFAKLADRVLLLEQGAVARFGPARLILDLPRSAHPEKKHSNSSTTGKQVEELIKPASHSYRQGGI